jgi:glyoxylase-like metal-dependent hydrolase (beta-lactamase superfamily II)
MTHTVTALPNGKWKQNCYIVSDDATGFALLIDPGSNAEAIRNRVAHHRLTPVAILNTHAHYDHIGAVAVLMAHYSVPFYLHQADVKLLKQANVYKMIFDSKESIIIPEPTGDLALHEAGLPIGGFEISVLFTPGHTKGSTCLQVGTDLFSGDTLLPGALGRTDLPGGDKSNLAQSVELLRRLPEEITVWPGHGKSFALASLWRKLAQAGVEN